MRRLRLAVLLALVPLGVSVVAPQYAEGHHHRRHHHSARCTGGMPYTADPATGGVAPPPAC